MKLCDVGMPWLLLPDQTHVAYLNEKSTERVNGEIVPQKGPSKGESDR